MASYRERLFWPGWFTLLLALAWGTALAGLVALVVRHGPRVDQLAALLVLVVVAYAWWRIRHLDIEAGPEGVAFGFGRLRRRVPKAGIVSAAAETYSVVRYMGWGYRLGWDRGERACSILGYGRGVRVVFDDEKARRWSVFLSSADPEAFLGAMDLEERKET